MSRYTAVAKFVGALVNVVVTDTQPHFRSDRTRYSYTQCPNIDGSRHFMLDGGGWTFLPHDGDMRDAVLEAARPLLAQRREVSPRAQDIASYRQMILRQIAHVRSCERGGSREAHCLGVLRDYLQTRRRMMARA